MPPRPARRERQPRMPIEVRRQQVLDAALKLISEHGYGAATMDAIAREADIAKPVVYNAYPGRAALLHALLDREEQRGLRSLADAMPPQAIGAEPEKVFLGWLESLAHAIATNPATWRLILLPPSGTPDEVRERVHAGRRFALAQAQTLADSMLRQQAPRANLDPELLGHSVFAICEHVARLMLEDPEEYPPRRVIEFAAALLAALRARPGSGS